MCLKAVRSEKRAELRGESQLIGRSKPMREAAVRVAWCGRPRRTNYTGAALVQLVEPLARSAGSSPARGY